MNNKIKAAEVACLIDGNEAYGQVFNALKEKLNDDEMIFAERVSGHGFLQWDLPGDGWTTIQDGDPIEAIDVKKELERRKTLVRSKFGDNHTMADKILSYPDDSYVYYKIDSSGQFHILITAWGYRHPVRLESDSIYGKLPVEDKKERVAVQLTYGGKPTGKKNIKLNGWTRSTDGSGFYMIGDLPIGYQFDIEIEGKKHHVTVTEGMGTLIFDTTVYADVIVEASMDGQPFANTMVSLSYCGQCLQLMTNDQGVVTSKLPLSLEGQSCVVSINPRPLAPQSQQKVLSEAPTHFVFAFVTSVEEEPKVEQHVEEVHQQNNGVSKEEVPKEEAAKSTKVMGNNDLVTSDSSEKEGGIWSSLLFVLLLAVLVGLSYYFGWRLL